MNLSIKTLLKEIIVEAAIGKKFPIELKKAGKTFRLIGIASANTKPGERPYRITWFTHNLHDNRHVDLSLDEMIGILEKKSFPPEIVQRVKERYPNPQDELIGDEYTLFV